jgi:hypothetical protein
MPEVRRRREPHSADGGSGSGCDRAMGTSRASMWQSGWTIGSTVEASSGRFWNCQDRESALRRGRFPCLRSKRTSRSVCAHCGRFRWVGQRAGGLLPPALCFLLDRVSGVTARSAPMFSNAHYRDRRRRRHRVAHAVCGDHGERVGVTTDEHLRWAVGVADGDRAACTGGGGVTSGI